MHACMYSHGDEERARRGTSEQPEGESDAAAPLGVVVDCRPTVGNVGPRVKDSARRGRGSTNQTHGFTMNIIKLDHELAITRARAIPAGMRSMA